MSDIMRWRYGDTHPVVLPVESDTLIEIGDLLFFDTDHVIPASDVDWDTDEETTQEALHDGFAGVAMQRSRSGDTAAIRVATTGVFELELRVSASAEVGALIGPVKGSGDALQDQQVVAVDTPNLAIGRCAKRLNPSGTRILVDIVGTLSHGGPQAAA